MALEVFRLVGSVFVDTEAANKSIKNTDKEAAQLGQTLVDGVKSMGKFAASVAGVALAAGAALASIAESTREYRTEQGKLQTAFETAGHSSEEARKTYEALNGVLGDSGQAVEAANHLAKLTQNEKDLNTWTKICTGVYATFGDSLPIEGLTEAANETAKTGALTGSLADALNWAGVNEDKFQEQLDSCTTEQERQALITKTLNGLYDEAADSYRENNAEVIAANEAQERLNNSMAKIGEIVEPILTKVKDGFAAVLDKVLELVDGSDLEAFGGMVDTAFGKFIDEILPKIVDGLQWIIDNKDFIIAGIIGIGTAMMVMDVANMIMGVVKAYQAFKAVTEGATIAQWLLNAAMSANPVGLIVAAIAGLVAAFVVLWLKCDAFRQFWIDLWEGIKIAFWAVVDWIKENWLAMLLFMINPMAGIFKYCYDHFEGFRNFVNGVMQSIKIAFWAVVDWIKENWLAMLLFLINPMAGIFKYCYDHFEGFRNFVNGIVTSVKTFFVDMWAGLTNGAKKAWQGVKDTFSKVATFFKDIFSKAWQGVKDVFSIGGRIFEGIKDGIANVFKSMVNNIIGGINKVVSVPFNAINKAMSRIRDISIAGLKPFSWIKTFAVPQIPKLETGTVLEKGQVGLLEGNGAEAVVPLDRNKKWISAVARDMEGALGRAPEGDDQVVPLLLDILSALETLAGARIYLDTGALVGGLAKPMDRKLGQLQAQKART